MKRNFETNRYEIVEQNIGTRAVGILVGWKEICAYLRVSRTQDWRWYRQRGLPVTNFGKRTKAAISALDYWLTLQTK